MCSRTLFLVHVHMSMNLLNSLEYSHVMNEKIACKMAVILYAHRTMLINCAFSLLVVEFNFRGLETIDGDWHYYSKLPYHTI